MAAVSSAALVAGVFSGTAGAAGCTDTWNGSAGTSDWATPGNWSNNLAPTTSDVACWSSGTTVTVSETGDVAGSIQGGDLSIAGGGVLALSSTTNNSTLDNLTLDGGGELDGPGAQTLAVGTNFTWGGGTAGAATLNNPATLTGAALAITTGSLTMDNTSTPTFDGGSVSATSAVTLGANLTLSGTTALTSTSTITAGATVTGTGGTFTAGGVTAGATPVYGFGSNALVLTGGTTTVASGNTLNTGPLSVKGGTLQNDGTVSVAGGYAQTGGTLALDISGTAPGSQYGQLQASGGASLGGALSLTDTGGFNPAQSNTFSILTSTGSRTGQFASVTGGSASVYNEQYGANGVTLVVPTSANCPGSGFDAYTASGGNWSTAANWSTGALPTTSQVACWNTGTTVTADGPSDTAASIQGGNLTVVSGGVLALGSGSSSVDTLSLNGGELDGPSSQTMTVGTAFSWGVSGSGSATLNATGAMKISGGPVTIGAAATPTFDGGSITTTSAITLNSGVNVGGGGGSFTAAGVAGSGSGTHGFGSNAVTLTGGTTTVASGSTLDTGSLSLTGGTLQNNGTVSVNGSYSQAGGATLADSISGTAAGSQYGQLQVTGGAALGGTLSLADTGGFNPAPGNVFSIVTSTGSRTGQFASVTGPAASAYSTQYGPHGFTLVVLPANCPSSNFDAYVASSGDWSVGSSWSTGAPPSGTQVACWASGTVVTVSDAESAASVQGGDLAIAPSGSFTLTGSGSSNVDHLTLDGGGDLEGPSAQTLTAAASFDWGGSGSGTAALNTSPGKGLKISTVALTIDGTSSAPTFGGGSINAGSSTVSITNANFTTAGAPGSPTLTTTGAINLGSGVDIGGSAGGFTAAGVSGAGTYGFGSNALTLTGGTTTVASGNQLDTGSLSITGGTLQNDGTVSVSGNYSQGSGATLGLDISGTTAGTQYGQLNVQGTASLAGHLSLTDIGGFTPVPPDTFSILTSGGVRTGTLTTSGASGGAYLVQYGPGGVTLAVLPPNCPGGSSYDAYIAGSGSWSTAANWSTGKLPTSSQVACWATGTTVTADSSDTAASIQGGDLAITGTLTLAASGTSSVDNLALEGGGQLDGPGGQTLTVGVSFDWGGTGSGAAKLNTASGSGLAINGGPLTIDGTSSTPTFGGGSINTTSSPVSITNPNFTTSGSPTLTTTNTITLGAGVNVGGSGGRFTAANVGGPGSGTYGFGSNGLTLTGGTTTVAGGSVLDTGSLSLTGGTLQDNGTVNVSGNYSQSSGATLALTISGTTAGSGFGVVAVHGTASLAGSLSLTDAGFTPAQTDTFAILTSTAKPTGTFTSLTGPNAGTYFAQYGPSGVTLAVTSTTCPATNFDSYVATGGDWSVAGNWSKGVPPTGTQVACWPATTTVTVSTAESVASIEGPSGNLSIVGGGVLTLGSPTTTTSAITGLALEGGGELDAPSGAGLVTLSVAGNFDWGGSGSGKATLNRTSVSNLEVNQTGTGTLTIDGTTSAPTFGGGSINTSSPVSITNPAFAVSGAPSLTTPSTITLGTGVNVTGTAGNFTAAGVVGPGSGTYGFGTNGLTLTGGTTTVASGSTLDTGTLSLTGGTLQNDGTVKVTGNYSQGSGGTLGLDIGGANTGQFGVLGVSGKASLGGSLSLNDAGTFTPTQAQTFTIITFGSLTGGIFTVTGPSAQVYVASYTTNVTLSVNPAPANTVAPAITGTPAVGQTLTCSTGTWTGKGDVFSFQWTRDGASISGATSATYLVDPADQGHTLACAVTASNSFGTSKPAVSAGVAVPAAPGSPGPPGSGTSPTAPVNSKAPAISGTPTPGNHLNCSAGTWSNSPTTFMYQWKRGGSTIARATSSTYTVQIADEAGSLKLTCTVTASNGAGAGAPVTSAPILVALPGTLKCAKPTGKVNGFKLGPIQLRTSRARARTAGLRHRAVGPSEDNFCLFGGWGIVAGYPPASLLGTLSAFDRARFGGAVVIALTSNPFYALDGARPGARLASVAKRLHTGKVIHIGSNDWYIVPDSIVPGHLCRGVLRVRHGVIQEIGIAVNRLTKNRIVQHRLLATFNNI